MLLAADGKGCEREERESRRIELVLPPNSLTTDNAAMIALAALAGVACAAETAITLDNAYIKNGEIGMHSVVEDILTAANLNPATTTALFLNMLAHGATTGNGQTPINTTLTLMNMLPSDYFIPAKGEKLILNSIQIVSRPNGQNRPEDAVLTLDNGLGTATPDYSAIDGSKRGLITFSFGEGANGVDITNLSTLSFGITSNTSGGFGYTCYQAKTGYTLSGSDTATSGVWHMPIRLNVTKVTTPEPATATLSLLALAGLAARRRRH